MYASMQSEAMLSGGFEPERVHLQILEQSYCHLVQQAPCTHCLQTWEELVTHIILFSSSNTTNITNIKFHGEAELCRVLALIDLW